MAGSSVGCAGYALTFVVEEVGERSGTAESEFKMAAVLAWAWLARRRATALYCLELLLVRVLLQLLALISRKLRLFCLLGSLLWKPGA